MKCFNANYHKNSYWQEFLRELCPSLASVKLLYYERNWVSSKFDDDILHENLCSRKNWETNIDRCRTFLLKEVSRTKL